ncbi:MAG: hypothetical protein FWF97_04575 [Alphaproteobacteria bacterium]|nr:hypothetical protein [Alphaproteobacteria bacterium]
MIQKKAVDMFMNVAPENFHNFYAGAKDITFGVICGGCSCICPIASVCAGACVACR